MFTMLFFLTSFIPSVIFSLEIRLDKKKKRTSLKNVILLKEFDFFLEKVTLLLENHGEKKILFSKSYFQGCAQGLRYSEKISIPKNWGWLRGSRDIPTQPKIKSIPKDYFKFWGFSLQFCVKLTSDKTAARNCGSDGVSRWGRIARRTPSSCPPPRPSPSGRRPSAPAGRSPTSWRRDRARRPPVSCCGPL